MGCQTTQPGKRVLPLAVLRCIELRENNSELTHLNYWTA